MCAEVGVVEQDNAVVEAGCEGAGEGDCEGAGGEGVVGGNWEGEEGGIGRVVGGEEGEGEGEGDILEERVEGVRRNSSQGTWGWMTKSFTHNFFHSEV